jgi:hypothetical protein
VRDDVVEADRSQRAPDVADVRRVQDRRCADGLRLFGLRFLGLRQDRLDLDVIGLDDRAARSAG